MAKGKLSLLFGLATGAILGVLFAPRKGKELRSKMKSDRKKGGVGIRPLGDDLKHVGRSLHKILKDVYKEVSTHESVKDAMDTGKDYFGDYIDEAKAHISDFKEHTFDPATEGARENVDAIVKRAKKSMKRVHSKAKKHLAKATPKKPVSKKNTTPKKKRLTKKTKRSSKKNGAR